MTDCLLVFPPVWEASAPYMAGPALAAYLGSSGHEVGLIDANILFWNHFREDEHLACTIYERCIEERFSKGLSLEESAAAAKVAEMTVEEFSHWFRTVSIGSPRYELLVRCFGGFRKDSPFEVEPALAYHDRYFSDISHSHVSTNSIRLYRHVVENESSSWRVFAREHLLPLIEERGPALLGISVVAPNQVVPAFALAVEARLAWPGLNIVFGGPWVTHLRSRIRHVDWFTEWGFLFTPFQGEIILGEMLEACVNGRDVSAISRRAMQLAEPRHRLPFNGLPTPDFSDLKLDAYAEPGHLPLMASRGCYWAKCRFCSYPLLEPKYERQTLSQLKTSIGKLVKRYNARHIPFTDPSMSVPLGKNIATTIERGGWDLTWGAFTRFESAFSQNVLDEFATGGCVVLHWGLESGSERILTGLCKGIDFGTVARVLEDATRAGIHNRLLMMYAFPDETEEDLKASLDFVERHLDIVGSVCWSRCTVEIDTPMGNDTLGSGTQPDRGRDLALGIVVPPLYGEEVLTQAELKMQQLSARATIKHHFPRTAVEVEGGS